VGCSVKHASAWLAKAATLPEPKLGPMTEHRGDLRAVKQARFELAADFRVSVDVALSHMPWGIVRDTPWTGASADAIEAAQLAAKEEQARLAVITERNAKVANRDRFLHEISPGIRVLKVDRVVSCDWVKLNALGIDGLPLVTHTDNDFYYIAFPEWPEGMPCPSVHKGEWLSAETHPDFTLPAVALGRLKPFTNIEWGLAARSIPDSGPVKDFKPVTRAACGLVDGFKRWNHERGGDLHGWRRPFLFMLLVRGHQIDPADAVALVCTVEAAYHQEHGTRFATTRRDPKTGMVALSPYGQIYTDMVLEKAPEAITEQEAAHYALGAMSGGYIAIGSLVEEDALEESDPLAALVAELAESNPDGFTSEAVYTAAEIRGIPLEPGHPKTARRVMTQARAIGLTKREVQRNGERVRLFTKAAL
jgi:hypothetical protein